METGRNGPATTASLACLERPTLQNGLAGQVKMASPQPLLRGLPGPLHMEVWEAYGPLPHTRTLHRGPAPLP